MRKLNNFRNFWFNMFVCLLLVSFGQLRGQVACDENTKKSLEATHISAYTEVTQGADAIFTIRYPLVGTTYTISDNEGNSYSFTYTSGTEEYIYINAGAVNSVRKFSLKAQKGACAYQTGFNYTITPQTALKLATRVEHEWCGNGGAIRFTLVGTGANNSNYNFYIKKSNVPTYNTTTSLSITGVTSLAAGKYDLLARPKSGTGDIEVKNIEIKKDLKDIDYTLSKIPATCASAGIGIKVDIKVDQWGNHSANYPVYYTLQDATGNNIPGKIRQTSNIFTGLTPGTYRVKVENFCGTSPTPKSITIASSNLTFTNLWGYPRPKEFNCDYVEFDSVLLYATSLTEAYTSDTFPYPLTVKYVITAPSGAVYTPTYTINNKSDFYLYLPVGTRDDLGVENGFREHRIPKEYGEWKIAAEVQMCGTTTAIPAVTATLYNPIENAYVAPVPDENSSDTCFKKVQLTLGHKYIRDNSPILNTYLVLEQAPATFNYTGAGFYQIPATHPNPLLRGKFVKKIKYNPQAYQTVVASDYTNLGDTFQFRLVDDECDTNRSNLMDAFTITTPPAPKPTNVAIRNVASCKDATATNAPYASMHIQRYVGADLDKIEVIEYNGNTTGTIPGTSLSLPYTLTASDRANNDNWYLRDLPPGNYKVRVTNVCGGVNVISKDLSGQTYSFSFAPGCEPIVQGRIDLAPTDDWRYTESSFVIQQFNEATQTWNQWAYSGLGFNQNINRKVTDEYLTRKGKFRVVRRISNLDNTFECMQVIAEKDFGGDLEEPDVIGVGCVGNKFHVVVIPKGGTGPFTYRLVHKIPAGSTTPDTSVARTQAGDNFFLDLDGTNLNTAYKFTVTDACPSTKDRELTLSNIRLPKIKAQKEYYCVGQSAVLKMDDLGPNITIEWYRSDNMAVAVATGHTLTIPALTAADFTNQYKVVIKIAGKPAAATCITNAIAAYQFQQITTYPSYTAPIGVDTSKCMEGNGAMYFDLNTLFTGTTLTTSGVTTTIEEASGVIAVPANGIININLSEVMGTHTFLYKILSPCGELITQATAKLTVARAFKPAVKTTIKVCNPSVTLNEVKQLINEGSPEVVAKQPIFHWYSSLSDAQAQTSEIAVTTSINTPNGSSQDYYLRFTKNNYCTETIYKITIVGETSVTAKTLTNTACQITTVADLKALVDPADTANVLIYKNGGTVALADETIIEDNVGYTYAKNVYRCVTSPAPLNFNFTPRSVAKNEQISVCTFIGYYGGLHTKVKDIKDALQVLYPTATITVLGSSSGNWYVQTNPNSDVSITGYSGFKIQEAGKCESLPYVVRLAQNDITPVQAQSITTCEEIMAGELADQLQATYGYTNVEIIAGRSTAPLARTAFVDWNTALYFTAEATGKCRSPKVPLTLIKDTNVTIATPKSFEVCKAAGQQPKVSDLKTVVGANARIFIRNNNQWQLQADNDNVSENNSYFYTIQEAGKCPSEKTALIVRITRKTPTPSAPTAATFCQGATLTSLKDYIDNNPQNVGTLRVYANNTDTTPLSNTTVLTNNTTYYFSLQDTDPSKCESDRRAIMVKLVPAPTVLASYTYCPGTKVETLWDAIDPNDSDHSLRIYENATGGTALSRNTLLRAGNYYVAESSSSSSLGSCETSRVPLTVVFHTSPTITVQPQDATYCKGGTATALSVTAIGSGTLSYQWYSNTTDSTIGGTPVGINNASYIPSTTAVGFTTYYYVEVSSTTGCAPAVSRTAKVIVEQPSTPTVAQVVAAGCGTLSTAKVSNYATYPTGTTFTITTATDAAVAGASIAADGTINGITLAGSYKVKATQGTCDSSPVTFTIDAALPVPASPTVAQVAAAGCGTLSTAKVSNYAMYPTGTTFTITTATDVVVAGASIAADGTINGITSAGSYKVKAKQGACTSETNFTIDAALPVPAAPTVTLTPASCTSLTVAKISNYVAGQTYWNGTTQLSVNATTHEITSLGVGTYTITTKNAGCESVASSSFEIKAKQAATTTTNPVGAIYAKDAIAAPLTVTATGEGVLSYQWFEATSPTATGTAVGSNSASYTPSTSTVGSKFYYVEVTGSCGTIRSAVAEIKVTPTIVANDDPDTTVGGGGMVEILSNDRLNGTPVTPTDVAITIPNDGGLTGLTVDNTTGKLKVPANATPGTYEVTYKICATGGTLCDTAKVKITVTGTPTTIQANDDGVWEVGTQGEFLTPSILDNDQIGTRIGLTSSDVSIEKTQGQPAPDSHLVMNADGRITVKSGIAIGTYIYYYTIIDKSNNQTSRAKAIIKVVNFVAQQDEYSILNRKDRPQNTPSVITNDEMDGKKPPVIGTDVTLTPGVPSHPNLHMNPDGTITIAPNTPDGTYTYEYTICRISNPTDCKTAKAIIHLHPSVVANDDDYSSQPVNVIHQSAVVGNVLANDTLGGVSITDPTKVTITLLDNGGLIGVTIASNGDVTIPQGTPAGSYRVRYNLCIADQLAVCDDAIITVVVSKEDPIEIYNGVSGNGDGKNDGFRIEGIENYRKNTLKIFNRWGVLVYQKEGYTNADPFTGYSNGRSTIERGKKLPQGTYYYILEYENSHNQTQTKSGWLYLKTE